MRARARNSGHRSLVPLLRAVQGVRAQGELVDSEHAVRQQDSQLEVSFSGAPHYVAHGLVHFQDDQWRHHARHDTVRRVHLQMVQLTGITLRWSGQLSRRAHQQEIIRCVECHVPDATLR